MIPTANTNEVHNLFSIERETVVKREPLSFFYDSKTKERMIPAARIKTITPWLTWDRASRLKLSTKHARLFMDLGLRLFSWKHLFKYLYAGNNIGHNNNDDEDHGES